MDRINCTKNIYSPRCNISKLILSKRILFLVYNIHLQKIKSTLRALNNIFFTGLLFAVLIIIVFSFLFFDIYYATCAQKIRLNLPSYSYFSQKTTFYELIDNFSIKYNLKTSISDKLKNKKIRGLFRNQNPRVFFQGILQANDAVCYFDNYAMHIYHISEIRKRIILLDANLIYDFMEYLKNFNVFHAQYPLRPIGHSNAIAIYGPPKYVEDIKRIADQFIKEKKEYIYEVIPLKYISATDKIINKNNQSYKKQGMLSIINAFIAKKNVSRHNKHQQAIAKADKRNNAIILYDNQANIKKYKKLISKIDQPSLPIKITIKIIDILQSKSSSTGKNRQDFFAPFKIVKDIKNFNQDTLNNILDKIRTQKSDDKLHMISHHTIITENNIPGILIKNTHQNNNIKSKIKDDIFMRDTSSKQDKKNDIHIQITPQIINIDTQPSKIKLSVSMQYATNGILQSANSSVFSEATVENGRYAILSSDKNRVKSTNIDIVPFLNAMPVIGSALFKRSGSNGMQSTRIFIVSALIIE